MVFLWFSYGKSSTDMFQASRCQAFSHLRRENETQVYLPKVRAEKMVKSSIDV